VKDLQCYTYSWSSEKLRKLWNDWRKDRGIRPFLCEFASVMFLLWLVVNKVAWGRFF